MLYYNSQPIFWNNQSLEKPDNALINSSYYTNNWILLGNNVSYSMNLTNLTFNIAANNSNFNTNYKWYKFVDNANHVYYYFLDSFTLNGATYVVTLTLDIWSTFISTYFDSNNLNHKTKVYFNQKEVSNKNLLTTNLSNHSYLFNVYQEHTNLSYKTSNYINNWQIGVDLKGNSLSTKWGMINSITQNEELEWLYYYSYVYKVNLMSGSEQNIGMTQNTTFISFSSVASNSSGNNPWSNIGMWNWWSLIQDTTDNDIDLMELPFDLYYIVNNQPQNNIQWKSTQEYNWTKNTAIENCNNLNCYYCDYNGVTINFNFFCLYNGENLDTFTNFYNYVESDCWTWFQNSLINLTPRYTAWSFGEETNPQDNYIFPISLLEMLYPYLFNFRKFSFTYMFQEYNFNYSNFNTIFSYFSLGSYIFSFVPNYPMLILKIYIGQLNSLNSFSNLIANFNFMSANITNTLSVSNNFLSQNRSIIQTSHAIVQNQSNLEWTKQSLDSMNIWNDITHPVETAESWTTTALNNQNLWREYSINYGSAKLAQLNKSNAITSAGSNSGSIANILMFNDSFLREYDLKNVIGYFDKYGYIYNKWDSLNTWFVKYNHNFVKISTGLEKLFNQSIPNSLVNTCIQMLSNGVIIWTNLFNNDIKYIEIESILNNNELRNMTFDNFCNTYFYNKENN